MRVPSSVMGMGFMLAGLGQIACSSATTNGQTNSAIVVASQGSCPQAEVLGAEMAAADKKVLDQRAKITGPVTVSTNRLQTAVMARCEALLGKDNSQCPGGVAKVVGREVEACLMSEVVATCSVKTTLALANSKKVGDLIVVQGTANSCLDLAAECVNYAASVYENENARRKHPPTFQQPDLLRTSFEM